MKIRYSANPAKLLEAILWIVSRKPGCDFHFILKSLFYADKFHLQKYGRPVTGDTYIKMSYGPVPSMAYDMLKGNWGLPAAALEACGSAFSVTREGRIPSVTALREPETDELSGTDIECLGEAIALTPDTFDSRTERTHQERAWIEASMNGEMDFELFIDENVPNREELIQYIRETSTNLAL